MIIVCNMIPTFLDYHTLTFLKFLRLGFGVEDAPQSSPPPLRQSTCLELQILNNLGLSACESENLRISSHLVCIFTRSDTIVVLHEDRPNTILHHVDKKLGWGLTKKWICTAARHNC
jgi:hypothetical protein